ncbi:HigA family addiction module antitoxin [Sphingomicrobium sp. XHP0235]|uniref:HigA family addiction module antitoxin n=1 Tax=Sphingomicrobium aquimarinum TaxID=3133971 RepID=UPI0031FEA351
MAIQLPHSISAHPGGFAKRNFIEYRRIAVARLADHIDVSRGNVSKVLNERTRMTADIALRLEGALGVNAGTLMRMQARWDEKVARETLTREIEPMEEIA